LPPSKEPFFTSFGELILFAAVQFLYIQIKVVLSNVFCRENNNDKEGELLVDSEAEAKVEDVFVPGTIHDVKVFDFWKNMLGASPWVLSTLQLGYKIPFETFPPEYEERNNATARARPEVIREAVEEMIKLKIVKVVEKKPRCVSPLGLVTKILSDGSEKFRVVFDASRCVNEHLEKLKVTLSHLEKALELTEESEWQSIFDLASCYYHVKIFEPHQTFLGAAFENAEGKKVYFVYQHLPFGLASAVHAITKIFKPILAYIHQKGIKMSLYIDDGRFLAKDLTTSNAYREVVYEVLTKAGWQISYKKSDKVNEASRIKEYLGFVIDSEKMEVRINEDKLQKYERMLEHALSCEKMDIKQLAKVQGKIIALIPSHGFLARVSSKSGYNLIESHTSCSGWKGSVLIPEGVKKEWRFFLENVRVGNGSPIRSDLNDVKVSAILDDPITRQKSLPNYRGWSETIMVSDASNFKVVSYNLLDSKRMVLSVPFTSEEKVLSSGLRELCAVNKTLDIWIQDRAMENKHIFWCTDSTNVVAFLNKGSGREHVQKVVFEIAKKAQKLRLVLTPLHLLRTDQRIQVADEESKVADTDDWSVDVLSFKDLDKQFSFDIDVFASKSNRRLERFYSKTWEEGCAGVDAFAQDWSSGMLWLAPPVSFLIKVAKRIRRCTCQGVIIIPKWPTALFYCYFFDHQKVLSPFLLVREFNPFIYQNQGAKSALSGKTDFKMLALYFKNSINQ